MHQQQLGRSRNWGAVVLLALYSNSLWCIQQHLWQQWLYCLLKNIVPHLYTLLNFLRVKINFYRGIGFPDCLVIILSVFFDCPNYICYIIIHWQNWIQNNSTLVSRLSKLFAYAYRFALSSIGIFYIMRKSSSQAKTRKGSFKSFRGHIILANPKLRIVRINQLFIMFSNLL